MIYTPRRVRRQPSLLTVSKTAALYLIGVASIAIPLGVAVFGNLGGIR